MAKKSAKSKGYRRQTVKKPYLSKRDIVVLCLLVAAVAVGAFFLFRYDDGALKVQNGKVAASGDNWLIVDGSNARGRSRYFKLGEIGEIEGYAREADTIATDPNIPQYVFTPDPADSDIVSVTVTSSHSGAEALNRYSQAMLASMEGTETGELQTDSIAGLDVACYTYTSAYAAEEADDAEAAEETAEAADEAPEAAEEADAEADEAAEAEPNRFTKSLNAYIDAAHDSCIVFHVESRADSADGYLPDEALKAVLEQAIAAVALESAD